MGIYGRVKHSPENINYSFLKIPREALIHLQNSDFIYNIQHIVTLVSYRVLKMYHGVGVGRYHGDETPPSFPKVSWGFEVSR